MTQTAAEVVGESLKAWDEEKGGTVISGRLNRCFALILKSLPRRVVIRVMGAVE